MSDEIPVGWFEELERRGLASYRRLGEAAGVSHETARRVVLGYRTTNGTLTKIADAMGVPVSTVQSLRDVQVPDRSREWEPPRTSALLSQEEREALSRLIALMTAGRSE